jgi:hypothetical protein
VKLQLRPDLSRDVMLLLGLGVGIAIAMGAFANPVDATSYWLAGMSTNLYPADWSAVAVGYLFYPPSIAQLSRLIQPIGWQIFIVLWMLLVFASFWFCARAAPAPTGRDRDPVFPGHRTGRPGDVLVLCPARQYPVAAGRGSSSC